MTTRLPKVFEHLPEHGHGLTDGQLLARFVAGRDEASFAALLRRHGPMVFGVCRRVLRDAHDAEDAFQATFLILARKASAVVKRDSVGSYLYAVAYHTALEAARAIARRRAREEPMSDLPQRHVHAADPAAAESDWRPLLDRELSRLSEKCRAALILCDLEGMPQRRAASQLGVSLSTLSSRLTRGRTLLAKRLQARGVALSVGVIAVALAAEAASAGVPVALESSTARVAALVAAGQLAAVPTPAAALMKGVMKAMFIRKLKLAIGVVMVAALLGALGFASIPATDAQAQDQPPPKAPDAGADKSPTVQVSRPVNVTEAEHGDFTGRTVARETVDLRCRLSGPLTKVACKEGMPVNKGTLLFEVDPRPNELEVEKASAEMLRSEANYGKAKNSVERFKTLLDKQTVSREEYDNALAEVRVAEAVMMAAKAGLARAKLDLEYTRVTSPIDGTIVRAPLSVGNYVNAGTTTVATIAATNPIAVVFDIDERTFLDLQDAARAGKMKSIANGKYPVRLQLSNEDEFKYEGVVESVGPQVDPTTGTVQARAILPNAEGRLIPGLFARIRLATGPGRKALLVDPEAVVDGKDGQRYLLIVNDKNVVERRAVTLGPMVDNLRSITAGLDASDLVVVRALLPKGDAVAAPGTVKPGSSVRPEVVVMSGRSEKKPPSRPRDEK
jgi:RND family efflux transporter MFP subunit